MIRVALVDDQELLRTGFVMILGTDAEFSVVAQGDSGEAALQIARLHKPDVMLLDISMPGGISGVEALARLIRLQPAPKVIMVSQHEDLALIRRVIDAGASGYVSKAAGAAELCTAIRRVMTGRGYVSAELSNRLAFAKESNLSSPFNVASARQLEVVISLAKGETALQLAKRLNISHKTVSTYKQTLKVKLGVRTDAELIRLALTHGIVTDHIALSALESSPSDDVERET